MYREKLPITALPAWSKLNDVNFLDIKVEDLGPSRGDVGLVTERTLNSRDTFDIPTLLTVPNDLILSAEAVEEHGKADQHFRQLLDAAGGKVCLETRRPTKGANVANIVLVYKRRYYSLPPDADHHRVTKPFTEHRNIHRLDGLLQVPPRYCSCAYNVERGREDSASWDFS